MCANQTLALQTAKVLTELPRPGIVETRQQVCEGNRAKQRQSEEKFLFRFTYSILSAANGHGPAHPTRLGSKSNVAVGAPFQLVDCELV
jgi:hypothetical protein